MVGTLVNFSELDKFYKLRNQSKDKIKERNILPLKATPLLANLCGHLIGDGTLRLTTNSGQVKFYGSVEKLNGLAYDYSSIFNNKIKIYPRLGEKYSGYMLKCSDTNAARILNYIGIPAGDKILTAYKIPNWIENGSTKIRKAFLQALFDDELEGLYKDKTRFNTWKGFKFKMSKRKELINEHIYFLDQIKKMLTHFGIETGSIKVDNNDKYSRKDGVISIPTYFRISTKKENRKQFYKKIGFNREKKKQENLIKSLD